MSMIESHIDKLETHIKELSQYYDRGYTIKLLKESAEIIRMLSEKGEINEQSEKANE